MKKILARNGNEGQIFCFKLIKISKEFFQMARKVSK